MDHEENHSLYVSALNASTYLGINYEEGIGIDMSASVLDVGYDGRIIDANVEILTVGITYMYKMESLNVVLALDGLAFRFLLIFMNYRIFLGG